MTMRTYHTPLDLASQGHALSTSRLSQTPSVRPRGPVSAGLPGQLSSIPTQCSTSAVSNTPSGSLLHTRIPPLCSGSWGVEPPLRRRQTVVAKSSSTGEARGDVSSVEVEGGESPAAPAWVGQAVNLFPLWVCLGCALALVQPQLFSWIRGRVTVLALAITMLGMGFTLSVDDLKKALGMPREVVAGVLLQYTVMPGLGFLISRIPSLPSPFAVGLVLVACCPGGTASNIVTYLAGGNVALSVLMTAASTFLAVVMTPLLTSLLAGQLVPVDGRALFYSTLQVVLLPVLSGSLLAKAFPRTMLAISPYSALFAVITVALIVGSGISSSAVNIMNAVATSGSSGASSWTSMLLSLIPTVALLHSGGFFLGYILPKSLLGLKEAESRTISIEVGMQNSILGVVLATQHFSSPLVAAPAAVSAVCHSVLGSVLAAFWRSGDREQRKAENITEE